MAKAIPLTEPVLPAADASPAEKEKYRRDREAFFTEGGRSVQKATARDTELATTTVDRLRALRKMPESFLDLQSPMKAAIWLALLKPTKTVLFEAEMQRRFRMQQMSGSENGEVVLAPEVPAIIALGNELVAAALSGDGSAMRAVADRIEGTPGMRQGDVDPEDPKRKAQTREIVDRVTRAMNARRIAADAEPEPIEATFTEVPTKEVEK